MLLIRVPPTVSPHAIDFGPQVERSGKGALYLRPNSVVGMTESEWEWVQNNRPSLSECFVVGSTATQKKLVPEKKVRKRRKRKKKIRDDG